MITQREQVQLVELILHKIKDDRKTTAFKEIVEVENRTPHSNFWNWLVSNIHKLIIIE